MSAIATDGWAGLAAASAAPHIGGRVRAEKEHITRRMGDQVPGAEKGKTTPWGLEHATRQPGGQRRVGGCPISAGTFKSDLEATVWIGLGHGGVLVGLVRQACDA